MENNIGRFAYSSSKSLVNSFTKSLSKEVARYNIRVNAIAPGFVRTNMIKNELELFEKYMPKKALGWPSDIAAVAATICSSKEGSFVNGETFLLTGGYPSPKLNFKL